MTRRGWLLFAAMGVIWGTPYLFIRVAAKHLSPPVVVFGRTSLAAIALIVIAMKANAIRPALERWKWVLVFAGIEMALPWLLLTNAEKKLPSGLTGLLVAGVPLVGMFIAFVLGDHHAIRPVRLLGLAVGIGGVAMLVGGDLGGDEGGIPWWSVVQVLLVCVCYATGPFVVERRLQDIPSIGVVALALGAVAVVMAIPAGLTWPDASVPASAWWSIVALAVLCTGIAFVVFFALIREIGPARSTLITFVNPAVAIVLGAIFLDEAITGATIAGFVLVMLGCWLATRQAPTETHDLSDEAAADITR